MIIKEEDAGTKFCCGPGKPYERCIGSRCMAWQWSVDLVPSGGLHRLGRFSEVTSRTHGQCGYLPPQEKWRHE